MSFKWNLLEEARKITNDLNNLSSYVKEGENEKEMSWIVNYRQVLIAELILITKMVKEIQKDEKKS